METPIEQTEQALRQTSDNFLTRVERLHALEVQKREVPPAETADLAREVEALSREVLEWAQRQVQLAETVAREDPADARPIAIIPARPPNTVLEEWRAAERVLDGLEPGTADWESARADVDRLRNEYARAYEAETRR